MNISYYFYENEPNPGEFFLSIALQHSILSEIEGKLEPSLLEDLVSLEFFLNDLKQDKFSIEPFYDEKFNGLYLICKPEGVL